MTDPGKPQQFNVTSHNQQGGVTAGQYIDQAPPATLQGRLEVTDDPIEGGLFETRYILTITEPHRVNRVIAGARSPSIQTISVVADRAGMQSFEEGENDDGFLVAQVSPATPTMTVTITTGKAGENIEFGARIEQ